MSVKELIEKLSKLPPDAVVYYLDGEYNGSTSRLTAVSYNKKAGLGVLPNTVILS